jgi:hypothetical protein
MRTLITALSLSIATSAFGQNANPARPSDTLNVGFVLIRADNSGRTDPSLGGLDSTLRGVLRFTGYRGVGAAASLAFPGRTFDMTFIAPDNTRPIDPQHIAFSKRLRVFCTVEQVNKDTSPATARLHVTLSRVDSATNKPIGPEIIVAGLTIPEDHVVVIGAGAYAETALALTVRWRKGPFAKKEE